MLNVRFYLFPIRHISVFAQWAHKGLLYSKFTPMDSLGALIRKRCYTTSGIKKAAIKLRRPFKSRLV
jgi:hypothetical protein